jgi:hypothetical protein
MILDPPLAPTGFWLWRQYWRHFLGSFFTVVYLPQKTDLAPPLEKERNSVQKHVRVFARGAEFEPGTCKIAREEVHVGNISLNT